jgi:predicted nuclease of predicted toxin-antitoxin system
MRLLFDESVPYRLRKALPNHTIHPVVEMGWSGTKNGMLLALAGASFDALNTVDKNHEHQQNLTTLPVAVVLLSAKSNELEELLPLIADGSRVVAALSRWCASQRIFPVNGDVRSQRQH